MGARGLKVIVPRPLRRRIGPVVRSLRNPIDVPRHRVLSSARRVLPDFLVIGAAKAGTSSVFYTLKHHPSVFPPTTKELGYFDVHYARGHGWYRAHFPTVGERARARSNGTGFATFEATPAYLFHPHAARRAAETVPDARLVAMLRNPVDRAYSHYQHHCRDGKETLSFAEAVDREQDRIGAALARTREDEWFFSPALQTFSYLARGRYAEQLEVWLRYFPRDRLLVVPSEALYQDPGAAFRRIMSFVGLPEWAPEEFVRRNEGGYQERIATATRQRLVDYFRPHNERLYALLGEDLGWT